MGRDEMERCRDALAAGYSPDQIFPCRMVPCACRKDLDPNCHMAEPRNWVSLTPDERIRLSRPQYHAYSLQHTTKRTT